MPEILNEWPLWYLALIGYTALVGYRALRDQSRIAASLRQTESLAPTPNDRAYLMGQRAARWAQALGWVIGACLLLVGWNWARALVAVSYAASAWLTFRDYAIGCAEGRKAAELASAHEYVRGRIQPRSPDYLFAGAIMTMTRVLPFAATIYAIVRLSS